MTKYCDLVQCVPHSLRFEGYAVLEGTLRNRRGDKIIQLYKDGQFTLINIANMVQGLVNNGTIIPNAETGILIKSLGVIIELFDLTIYYPILFF